MANLTHIEKIERYVRSLEYVVYNYVNDYTYEQQCTLIKALLELLESEMTNSEYETVSEEDKININSLIERAKAILKPFNI